MSQPVRKWSNSNISVIDWTAGVVIQKRKIFAEPQKLLKLLSLVILYLGKWANRPSPILVRSYLATFETPEKIPIVADMIF